MPKSRRRKPKTRPLDLKAETAKAMRENREAFHKKFGRDLGPGDPVFFDPDANTPQPMSLVKVQAETLAAMTKAGAPPEVMYAFKKTGLIYVEGLTTDWPEDRLREWHDAIEEYHAIEKAKHNKPAGWKTEIPELLASPFSQEDFDNVRQILLEIAPIEGGRPMSVVSRIEIAAAFLATACSHAFDAGEATLGPGSGPGAYDQAEEIVIRRAREIYGQGGGMEETER